MNEQQQIAIIENIKETKTQQYLSAYLAALGSNIHVGEKRARKLARDAGRCALKYATKDFHEDLDDFSEACQESFNHVIDMITEAAEERSNQLLVPERFVNGENGVIKP